MQVREMLEKAELEVQEALEQGQDDVGSQGEVEDGSDQRTGRVFVDIDDEVEQVSGGKSQVARISNGSEDEDEDEE